MSNNDIFSTIVESHRLSADIDLLRTHLDHWISNGGQSIEKDKFEPSYQQLIESDRSLNEAEILERLTEFRKYLQSLPIVELTIAFEPDDAFKDQVSKKLAGHVKGNFIVKFIVDREIIAGCLINFNGRFQDYSLLKVLEERKAEIFEPILKEIH